MSKEISKKAFQLFDEDNGDINLPTSEFAKNCFLNAMSLFGFYYFIQYFKSFLKFILNAKV